MNNIRAIEELNKRELEAGIVRFLHFQGSISKSFLTLNPAIIRVVAC
jgi:hypothetical protein